MIERYTREEMGRIWSRENRFKQLLKVEKAVAFVQARHGLIPQKAYQAIYKKAQVSLKTIDRLEKKTKHDVSAFVQNASHHVGKPWGRFFHYGLTSSDVLDTALSLQVVESSLCLKKQMLQLKKILKKLALKHKETLLAGRTHGMHAEPTTFGFKLAGFFAELRRAEREFFLSVKENARGMISGPVGNYPLFSQKIEKQICAKLGLKPEDVSTQVIPRDRHAHLLFSLCRIGGVLERLAVELRHLQRTEIGEAMEGFSKGQQGSSSMPHKKNPVSAENITGIARLLRSYLSAGMENQALWHERDISHSSVERVIFPDSFILCDYALFRMTELLENLQVFPKRMEKNMQMGGGNIFSSYVLSHLVAQGVDRQTAYQWIQKASKEGLYQAVTTDQKMKKYFTDKKIQQIFSGVKIRQRIGKMVEHKIAQATLRPGDS